MHNKQTLANYIRNEKNTKFIRLLNTKTPSAKQQSDSVQTNILQTQSKWGKYVHNTGGNFEYCKYLGYFALQKCQK